MASKTSTGPPNAGGSTVKMGTRMLPPTPTVPISSPAVKPRGSANSSRGALVSMVRSARRISAAERRKRGSGSTPSPDWLLRFHRTRSMAAVSKASSAVETFHSRPEIGWLGVLNLAKMLFRPKCSLVIRPLRAEHPVGCMAYVFVFCIPRVEAPAGLAAW
eukprot:scaffold312_cov256-Pinguiococcus_pyrenoidosus.AAC.16